MCISHSTCPRRNTLRRCRRNTPPARPHTRARSSPERTPRDSQLVRRVHQSDRVESDSLRARERLRAPAGVRREAMTPRFASPGASRHAGLCVAALAPSRRGRRRRRRRISPPRTTTARTLTCSPSSRATSTASGARALRRPRARPLRRRSRERPSRTRRGPLHPTTTSASPPPVSPPRPELLPHRLWQRHPRLRVHRPPSPSPASSTQPDHLQHGIRVDERRRVRLGPPRRRGRRNVPFPRGPGRGRLRGHPGFLPRVPTPRAREIRHVASQPVGAATRGVVRLRSARRVVVGCTSYGNGARPTDMGWDIYPVRGDAVASTRGDRFAWGANAATTHCLSAGSYEFVARDFGNADAAGTPTSLAVLELTPANGMYFHGRPLGGSADSPTWFDRGESAKFTFDARARRRRRRARPPAAGTRRRCRPDHRRRARSGASPPRRRRGGAPRANHRHAPRLAADARSSTKASVLASPRSRRLRRWSRRRRPPTRIPAADATPSSAPSASPEATGAYGATTRRRCRRRRNLTTVHRASSSPRAWRRGHLRRRGRLRRRAIRVGHPLRRRAREVSRRASRVRRRGAWCSLRVSRLRDSNVRATGAACSHCRAARVPPLLTPTARAVTSHPRRSTMFPARATDASSSRVVISTGPSPERRRRRERAALGGGVSAAAPTSTRPRASPSTSVADQAAARGCESFHAFHVAGADGAFAPDDLSCRLCGRGGHGAACSPRVPSDRRAPAPCITRHNFTLDVRSPVECGGVRRHRRVRRVQLRIRRRRLPSPALGPDAKDGMLWRRSGVSPTGVAGYARFTSPTRRRLTRRARKSSAKAREGRCASK